MSIIIPNTTGARLIVRNSRHEETYVVDITGWHVLSTSCIPLTAVQDVDLDRAIIWHKTGTHQLLMTGDLFSNYSTAVKELDALLSERDQV